MLLTCAVGVIASDFMERAQFRGDKAALTEAGVRKVLESGPVTQTPDQARLPPPPIPRRFHKCL